MDKLSDLELEKRIAGIEGVTLGFDGVPQLEGMRNVNGSWKYYNPLIDDALCFQLMKKHDINNSRAGIRTETGEIVYCAKKHDSNAELAFSRSRNKVILLAIVEANNG